MTDSQIDPRLERAKEYLAIAESEDSKRAAYIKAAEEIAAAVADGMTQVTVATVLGKKRFFVQQLLAWRKSGYEADTPWLHDKDATTRAARSHARALLADPAEVMKLVPQILAALDNDEVMQAVEDDEEATDHLFAAVEKFGSHGKGEKVKSKKSKQVHRMQEMLITLELSGVLSKLRDLAKEDSSSPLIAACKDLMRETLTILDAIQEADDPETVSQMFSDFEDLLSQQ